MGFKEGLRPWFSRGKGTRATGWLTHLLSWLAILLCGQTLFKLGTESWTLTSPVYFCLFSLLTSVPFEKLLQQVQAVNKQEKLFPHFNKNQKGQHYSFRKWTGRGNSQRENVGRPLEATTLLSWGLSKIHIYKDQPVLVLNELLIYPF